MKYASYRKKHFLAPYVESTEVFQIETAERCFPGTAKKGKDHEERKMLISGCKVPVTLEEQVLVLCATAYRVATGHSILSVHYLFQSCWEGGALSS